MGAKEPKSTIMIDEELKKAYEMIKRPEETAIDMQKRLIGEAGYGNFLYSTLQKLLSELKKGNFENIEDLKKAVLYLYYGAQWNGHNIITSDIERYGLTNSCVQLAQFNIVKQTKDHRFHTWHLLEKYHEAGKELALQKIADYRTKHVLEDELSEFPNEIIALFLMLLEEHREHAYEYPGASRAYFFDTPFGSILENNRDILKILDSIAKKLEGLDLGIIRYSYVSTRGGELREQYFVTCEGVLGELNKILKERKNGDVPERLLADELMKYHVYKFVKEWLQIFLTKEDASPEDFSNSLEKNKISFDNLKEKLKDHEKKGLIEFKTLENSPPMIYKGDLKKCIGEIMKSLEDSILSSFTSS